MEQENFFKTNEKDEEKIKMKFKGEGRHDNVSDNQKDD